MIRLNMNCHKDAKDKMWHYFYLIIKLNCKKLPKQVHTNQISLGTGAQALHNF